MKLEEEQVRKEEAQLNEIAVQQIEVANRVHEQRYGPKNVTN